MAIPKITLSTSSLFPRKTERAFELASDLGYDGVEVMVWQESLSQSPEGLNKLQDRYQIPIRSIHAPSLVISQNVWGTSPSEKVNRSVELAKEVGAQLVVVHPPFAWQPKFAAGFAEQVSTLSESSGITIAVENMYPWRRKNRSYLAYLPHWDPISQPYSALTLDVSHASTAGQNSLSLAKTYGRRLRHLHFTDGTGSNSDEHLVPGQGTQPCSELLHHLVATHYTGDVCIEVSTKKYRDETKIIKALTKSLSFSQKELAKGKKLATQQANQQL